MRKPLFSKVPVWLSVCSSAGQENGDKSEQRQEATPPPPRETRETMQTAMKHGTPPFAVLLAAMMPA